MKRHEAVKICEKRFYERRKEIEKNFDWNKLPFKESFIEHFKLMTENNELFKQEMKELMKENDKND